MAMTAADWNTLVALHPPRFGAFLQSWEWGEYQERLGHRVRRHLVENAHGIMIAQAIWQPMPLGLGYWLIPKGPLGTLPPAQMREELRQAFGDGAFVKCEPGVEISGAVRAHDRHPSATLALDLQAGWEMVEEEMKPKMRYNARLALRRGVTVHLADADALPEFLALMEDTTTRDGFSAHAPERYRALLSTLTTPSCRAFLAIAHFQGAPLAANIMVDAFGVRTYLHGASSSQERELKAPAALQATLIADACGRGMAQYDFWGVVPPGGTDRHPLTGVTRFKSGFGGSLLTMPGTRDLPFHPLRYAAFTVARKLFR